MNVTKNVTPILNKTAISNPNNESHEFPATLSIIIFVLCVILLRMLYNNLSIISKWIPESLVLLLAGIIFGGIVNLSFNYYHYYHYHHQHQYQNSLNKFIKYNTIFHKLTLTPDLFFHYLLPPIILDSSYTLYNRTIINYINMITLFAVLGTILNFLFITIIMYGMYEIGAFGKSDIKFNLKSFFLFASIIIAVDPVAVLSIFQDIGVNLGLYYMVFGESLFNDAVTIVLYNSMSTFTNRENITFKDILLSLLSIFTITLGGVIIGLIMGIITCLLTRIHSSMEVIIVILIGYISYLLSEFLNWSGMIAMITCGLIQASYAFHNLHRSSVLVVRKLIKLLAEVCESIIFLFIGSELFGRKFLWHTGFNCWALIACLLARTITVPLLSIIINYVIKDNIQISKTEQLILIYGGLRGAVCFCLAILIKTDYFQSNNQPIRDIIITTTLFIIIVTIFFMGLTIKPLVIWLKVPMHNEQELSLFKQLNEHIIDETLSGLESITGERGPNLLRDIFLKIDKKYIRKILQRDPQTHDQKMVLLYEKIALKLHYAMIQPDRQNKHLANLPESIKLRYLLNKTSGTDPVIYPTTASELMLNQIGQDNYQIDLNKQIENVKHIVKIKPVHVEENSPEDVASIQSSLDKDIPKEMSSYLRSTKRASLASHGKRQLEFDHKFMGLLLSKTMLATNRSKSLFINNKMSLGSEIINYQNQQLTLQRRFTARWYELPKLKNLCPTKNCFERKYSDTCDDNLYRKLNDEKKYDSYKNETCSLKSGSILYSTSYSKYKLNQIQKHKLSDLNFKNVNKPNQKSDLNFVFHSNEFNDLKQENLISSRSNKNLLMLKFDRSKKFPMFRAKIKNRAVKLRTTNSKDGIGGNNPMYFKLSGRKSSELVTTDQNKNKSNADYDFKPKYKDVNYVTNQNYIELDQHLSVDHHEFNQHSFVQNYPNQNDNKNK